MTTAASDPEPASGISFPGPGEERFFFGPVERPLFGVFHPARPSDRASLPGAPRVAVLCSPFGTEAMSLHRTFRQLAEQLAGMGVATLRFDLDGTGNAAGSLGDPGRLRAWIDSAHAAITEVRARAGAGSSARVLVFGARFGASIATLAALEDGGVAGIALWAPAVSGRGFARELRAVRLLGPRHKPKRADGGHDIGGYLVTATTLDEIAAVDLVEAARGRALPPRILIVPGDSVGEAERLAREWSTAGSTVTVGSRVRYASLIDYPHETVVPVDLLVTVQGWAGTFSDVDSPAARAAHPIGSTARLQATIPRHTSDTHTTRESLVTFGDGERLFGVVTEPLDGMPAGRPMLCFLNAGVNHHVGPHRFMVTLARALAASGYASLRFDARGLGESDAARRDLENRVYAHTHADDVRSALTALETSRGPPRFVLVGLCSGAHPAFHAARADARVVGLVLLNSHTFDWQEGDPVKSKPSRRFYAEILVDPRHWRDALATGLRLARFRRVLGELMRSEIRLLARELSPRERAKMADVRSGFESLCERGVKSLLVFSTSDGGLDMMSQTLGRGGSKLAARSHVDFEMLHGFDH
jgi:alpha-beta hydrolase superfamily lysophospholipase